jgi:hypothetical protein
MSPELGREKVSLTNGYWFYFDEDGTQIVAHGSAFSGNEAVFIDGEMVSSKRSFKRKSSHDFQYKGHDYQVAFFMQSMLTGTLNCSLYKEGELVSSTTKSYSMKTFNWKTFFTAMAVGAVFGFSSIWLLHRFF